MYKNGGTEIYKINIFCENATSELIQTHYVLSVFDDLQVTLCFNFSVRTKIIVRSIHIQGVPSISTQF